MVLPAATAHGLPIGDLGPCCVSYDYGESGELELTPYLGNVVLRQSDSISPVQEEGYGDADVDGVFAGSPMELEIPLARSSWTQLNKLPGITRHTIGTKEYVVISNKCGSEMYENSVELMIKPIRDGVCSTNPDEWIWLFRVHPFRAMEVIYNRADQRTIMTHFKVFPCLESGCEGEFGKWGYPYPESGTLESAAL